MPIAFPSLGTMNFLCHLGKWITAERLNILLAVLTLLLAVLTFLLAWRVAHPPESKNLWVAYPLQSFCKRVDHSSPRARASILEFCYSIYRISTNDLLTAPAPMAV